MTIRIDRDKLRVALQGMDEDTVFDMLGEALDLLPPAKLAVIVGHYLDVAQLRPDSAGSSAMRSLLTDVRGFDATSRAGHYYESFRVNSRNYMDTSRGTREFIAECNRLFKRCVAVAPTADPAEASEAFEILINLLRHIDQGHGDVVFFADEGGSWQVGVDWATVFPVWFGCLARTAAPDEYARRVVETVDEFESYARDKRLATARQTGTAEQQAAIDAYLETEPCHRR